MIGGSLIWSCENFIKGLSVRAFNRLKAGCFDVTCHSRIYGKRVKGVL